MKPFTQNVIFWDSEFTSVNPYEGELLSVGFVKYTGEELYLELEYEGELNPWVNENVIPFLNGKKSSREEAARDILAFMGDSRPFLISYVTHFDSVYLYKLLGVKQTTKDFPFHWIPIDFATMLFASGINPEQKRTSPDGYYHQLGIEIGSYQQHNALDDARFLRDVYMKYLDATNDV